jgi:hypothetical protein
VLPSKASCAGVPVDGSIWNDCSIPIARHMRATPSPDAVSTELPLGVKTIELIAAVGPA